MSEFDQKPRNSSFCACAVIIWPKILVNAHQLPKYPYYKVIGVTKLNCGGRILMGSLEIAVYAHAQYKFGQNSPE